jgi:hypothetical protein
MFCMNINFMEKYMALTRAFTVNSVQNMCAFYIETSMSDTLTVLYKIADQPTKTVLCDSMETITIARNTGIIFSIETTFTGQISYDWVGQDDGCKFEYKSKTPPALPNLFIVAGNPDCALIEGYIVTIPTPEFI